ncbi:MAG: SMEK domain-containing protein [Verrucomicrobiales bacterium]
MTFERQRLLDEIEEWLARLDRALAADKALNRTDSAKAGENFARDLLKLLYGWTLENANFSTPNQDSYDLASEKDKLAVQVTVTTGAGKVRKTLKSFIPNHRKTFTRLVFFYPKLGVKPSSGDFSTELDGYPFDPKNDSLCLDDVLKKADDMTVPELEGLLRFLERELQPLDRTLSTGVDPTMDVLIRCIAYMSETVPAEEVDFVELSPSQEEKLRRLNQNSKTLLAEYHLHQEFHATLAHAREAVGCDTVRAAKIQKWLKAHSIRALDAAGGDARAALEAMARDLLARAHSSGTQAEEDAVRFLLADELISCNVFPNPANT